MRCRTKGAQVIPRAPGKYFCVVRDGDGWLLARSPLQGARSGFRFGHPFGDVELFDTEGSATQAAGMVDGRVVTVVVHE